MTDNIPKYTLTPYRLPLRKKRERSGIERGPKRIWLRHRKFVRSFPCVVCQCPQVHFAHIRTAENSGTGLKPHDRFGVPLCANHHAEQHRVGQGTFEDRYQIDLMAIAAEFVRRSPDMQMRLSLMAEEDQPKPDFRAGAAVASTPERRDEGRPSCEPRSRVAAASFREKRGGRGGARRADDPAPVFPRPLNLPWSGGVIPIIGMVR